MTIRRKRRLGVPREDSGTSRNTRSRSAGRAKVPVQMNGDWGVAVDAAGTSTRQETAFRHQQLLYATDDEYLAGTWRFVQDGLSSEDAILAVLPPDRQLLLKSALGSAAHRIQFSNMTAAGANPNLVISIWRDFADHNARLGRSFRGIGEPAYPGRRPEEYAEVVLHESLCNLAFRQGPGWSLMCPYDIRELQSDVVDAGRATHPQLWNHVRTTTNQKYAGDAHAEMLMRAELAPPVGLEIALPVIDIRATREAVSDLSTEAGMAPTQVEQLALATHEVAANAHRHGEPPPEASAWIDGRAVTVQIRGGGHFADPLAGRLRPNLTDGSGRGLWMANHLCDLVQVRNSSQGAIVRLICWLGGSHG